MKPALKGGSIQAVLVKKAVNNSCPECGDPLMGVEDRVELGTYYTVWPETKETQPFHNMDCHVDWTCEMVWARSPEAEEGWMPAELLMSGGMRV